MNDPFKIGALILGVLAAASFVVGLALAGQRALSASTQQQDAASGEATAVHPQAAIPPLDAATAARTETATFALG
jgi:hypothetical protein